MFLTCVKNIYFTFIHMKYLAHIFKYKIRDFLARGKIKFRTLQDVPKKSEFLHVYAYNRVIWLRLSVQTIKLDLATLASAHTWRVTRRVGFRKVDRGTAESGGDESQDQRRPAAIPYLLRDILRENWCGQARVARRLVNFDHFTCGTCAHPR